MGKFDAIIEKYSKKGVSSDNLEYAIDAVKEGTKREFILESLTADYRGMNHEESTVLLEDLFAVNGGEFKKENRGGYLYGALFLILGITSTFFLISGISAEGVGGVRIKVLLLGIAGVVGGIGGGLYFLIKSARGKFRDNDEPFRD